MLVFAVVFSNVYAINKSNNRSKTVKSEKTLNTVTRVNHDTIAPDSSWGIRGHILFIDLSKAKPYKPENGPAI